MNTEEPDSREFSVFLVFIPVSLHQMHRTIGMSLSKGYRQGYDAV